MSVIDVAVIGAVGYSLLKFRGYRKVFSPVKKRAGFGLVIAGLSSIALFHFSDLLTMHLFPLFMPMHEAMTFMERLHLEYEWIVTLVGIGGIALGFAIISRDLARVTQETRENEVRFQDMVEATADWFWEMDANLKFTYHSDRYFDVTGFRPEDKIGTSRTRYSDSNDSADANKWSDHFEDLKAYRAFKDFEYSFETPDGSVCHVRVSGLPIFDADGAFRGYRGTGTDITEQKRAEKALQKSEQRLRDIANAASDYFWETDEELRFSYVSERFFEVTALRSVDILGKTRWDFHQANTEDGLWREHRQTMEAHKPFRDFVIPYPGADGSTLYASVSGVPVFGEKGAFMGYRGTSSDITERMRAEEKLRESESRFHDFADAASDWFWAMDGNLRFNYISERFSEAVGLPPRYLLGKTRRDLLRLRDPVIGDVATEEDWQRHIEDLDAHKPIRDFRHSRVLSDGRVIHLAINAKPIFDADGEFTGYRGTGTNITEQVNREIILTDQEEQLREAQALTRAAEGARSKSM
ncbi:MAG: PAS domain-containing protein [Alphaproteobacteria bacterium]|nr:PAS domain-containing protein [Alphaproteobacteria bacterium]